MNVRPNVNSLSNTATNKFKLAERFFSGNKKRKKKLSTLTRAVIFLKFSEILKRTVFEDVVATTEKRKHYFHCDAPVGFSGTVA